MHALVEFQYVVGHTSAPMERKHNIHGVFKLWLTLGRARVHVCVCLSKIILPSLKSAHLFLREPIPCTMSRWVYCAARKDTPVLKRKSIEQKEHLLRYVSGGILGGLCLTSYREVSVRWERQNHQPKKKAMTRWGEKCMGGGEMDMVETNIFIE